MKKVSLLLAASFLLWGCSSKKMITKTTRVYTGMGTDMVIKLRTKQTSMLGEDFIETMFPHDDTPVEPLDGITQLINKHLSYLKSEQRQYVRLVIFADRKIPFGRIMRVLLSAVKTGIVQYQVGLYKSESSQEFLTFKTGVRLPISFLVSEPDLVLGDLVGMFSQDGTDLKRHSEIEESLPQPTARLGTYPTPFKLVESLEPLAKKSPTKRLYMLFSQDMEFGYVVRTMAALNNQLANNTPSPSTPRKSTIKEPKKSSSLIQMSDEIIYGMGQKKTDEKKSGKKTAKKKVVKKTKKGVRKTKKVVKKKVVKKTRKKVVKKTRKKVVRKKRVVKKTRKRVVKKKKVVKKFRKGKMKPLENQPVKPVVTKKPTSKPVGKKAGVTPRGLRGDSAQNKPENLKHSLKHIYIGLLRPKN